MKAFKISLSSVIVTILSLSISSCKGDETSVPTTLLTFYQDESYEITTNSDDWIYATANDGTVLDAKQYEANQTITLQTTKTLFSKTICITIFRYKNDLTSENLTFRSYLGISINDSWTLKSFNTTPAVLGTATLNVTDFDPSSITNLAVSDNFPGSSLSSGSTNNELSIALSLRKTPSKFQVSAYRNSSPVFIELNNVTAGQSLTANFRTDFKPVDHKFSLYFPLNNYVRAQIAGVLKSESTLDPYFVGGYISCMTLGSSGLPGPFELGYNDGFDVYKTSLEVGYRESRKGYFKVGAVPSSLPLLDYALTISQPDYKNFTFFIVGPYQVRTSTWAANDVSSSPQTTTTWFVSAPQNSLQNLQTIPDEILAIYRGIIPPTIPYQQTTFYVYKDNFSYDNYIGSILRLSESNSLHSNEYQTITFF